MKSKTTATPKVEAAGTLLLTPRDKKRLARVLKQRQLKAATYLRDVVLIDMMRHEAKKERSNG
jgi:hypothetical protein